VLNGRADAQLGTRQSGDPRVAGALDRVGVKYAVDGDGDFRLTLEKIGTVEPQLVYINSQTTKLGALEIREIWAPGAVSEKPFSQEALAAMLTENHRTVLGAWRIVEIPQGQLAVFAAQVSADSDALTLVTVALAVGKVAELSPMPKVGKESSNNDSPARPRVTGGRLCAR